MLQEIYTLQISRGHLSASASAFAGSVTCYQIEELWERTPRDISCYFDRENADVKWDMMANLVVSVTLTGFTSFNQRSINKPT
jgi:hypothetical protein